MVEHIDDLASDELAKSPKSDHSLDRHGDLNEDIQNNLSPNITNLNTKHAKSGPGGTSRKMLSSKIKSSPLNKSSK